jgi:hypothetical protein
VLPRFVVVWANIQWWRSCREAQVSTELDKRLRDDDVMSEIEMTSNLMIAASEVDGPLTQAQVDAILGL